MCVDQYSKISSLCDHVIIDTHVNGLQQKVDVTVRHHFIYPEFTYIRKIRLSWRTRQSRVGLSETSISKRAPHFRLHIAITNTARQVHINRHHGALAQAF
jgi:hypothetical protein